MKISMLIMISVIILCVGALNVWAVDIHYPPHWSDPTQGDYIDGIGNQWDIENHSFSNEVPLPTRYVQAGLSLTPAMGESGPAIASVYIKSQNIGSSTVNSYLGLDIDWCNTEQGPDVPDPSITVPEGSLWTTLKVDSGYIEGQDSLDYEVVGKVVGTVGEVPMLLFSMTFPSEEDSPWTRGVSGTEVYCATNLGTSYEVSSITNKTNVAIGFAPIPEPSTILIFSMLCGGFGATKRFFNW